MQKGLRYGEISQVKILRVRLLAIISACQGVTGLCEEAFFVCLHRQGISGIKVGSIRAIDDMPGGKMIKDR